MMMTLDKRLEKRENRLANWILISCRATALDNGIQSKTTPAVPKISQDSEPTIGFLRKTHYHMSTMSPERIVLTLLEVRWVAEKLTFRWVGRCGCWSSQPCKRHPWSVGKTIESQKIPENTQTEKSYGVLSVVTTRTVSHTWYILYVEAARSQFFLAGPGSSAKWPCASHVLMWCLEKVDEQRWTWWRPQRTFSR